MVKNHFASSISTQNQQHLVHSPEIVLALLYRLYSARAPLSLSFHRDPGSYPSAIIDINESQRLLLLDELADASAHRRVHLGMNFKVEASLGGVLIRFAAKDASMFKDAQGRGLYQIALPRQLLYHQKRSHYRVPLSGSVLAVSARLIRSHRSISGIMIDLSQGGVGILIREAAKIRLGDRLDKVRLELAGQTLEILEMEVCALQRFPQKGFLRLGCRFLELSQAMGEVLKTSLVVLERQQLKKY
jgi:c-di-GMP-binding flagellar brake protein YcgR